MTISPTAFGWKLLSGHSQLASMVAGKKLRRETGYFLCTPNSEISFRHPRTESPIIAKWGVLRSTVGMNPENAPADGSLATCGEQHFCPERTNTKSFEVSSDKVSISANSTHERLTPARTIRRRNTFRISNTPETDQPDLARCMYACGMQQSLQAVQKMSILMIF